MTINDEPLWLAHNHSFSGTVYHLKKECWGYFTGLNVYFFDIINDYS